MFRKLAIVGLLLALALCAPIAEAAKIHQLVDATVYLKGGKTEQYKGATKLSMPHKTDALQRVENAYTKNQKKAGEIPSSAVDSVVMWLPTRPDSRYTFVFVPKYGWCTLLDKTAQSSAYFYSGGGYRIRPDGGLWYYDNRKLIVDRDGKTNDLKNPYDMNPDKFATKLAEISGGDTRLEARLKYLLGRERPENYVRIVKMNGDTIYGYLHNDAKTVAKNLFSKSGTLLQYINISDEPDGKRTRYSADEVSEIRWFDNNIAPNTRVSMSVNAPRMFKAKNYTRGFTWLWDRRPAGSIIKYEVWETSGGRNPISRLVPVVSVYFEGAKGAYMLSSNGYVSLALLHNYMKDAAPEFHKMLKEYYGDSPNAKAHCNELKDNPSRILDLYEEYLKTHDYIDDRPDVKVSDDEKNADKDAGKDAKRD